MDTTELQPEVTLDGVTYVWRGQLTDGEMVDLVRAHGGQAVQGWWDQIRAYSLGWVTARGTDGAAIGLLKHRSNFGASWSNRHFGFGVDGHYFHSRAVPFQEWPKTHNRQINPYWQFDAFVQTDLGRWLLKKNSRIGLRGQLRVNNLLDAQPPRYSLDPSGAGYQSYGDWRRQTYAISLQATF